MSTIVYKEFYYNKFLPVTCTHAIIETYEMGYLLFVAPGDDGHGWERACCGPL